MYSWAFAQSKEAPLLVLHKDDKPHRLLGSKAYMVCGQAGMLAVSSLWHSSTLCSKAGMTSNNACVTFTYAKQQKHVISLHIATIMAQNNAMGTKAYRLYWSQSYMHLGWGALMMTSLSMRLLWVWATSQEMTPPQSCATKVHDSCPRAFTRHAMSCASLSTW